jgi:uncharacterized membrane protein YcaP (DUF421 family)
MADDYRTVADGLLLVSVIIFWAFALDWLGYHFPRLQPFVHPPPLLLVKDGAVQPRNMRRELITEGELMAQLRQQGVEDVSRVKRAHMEGDGRISVILRKGDEERRQVRDKNASRERRRVAPLSSVFVRSRQSLSIQSGSSQSSFSTSSTTPALGMWTSLKGGWPSGAGATWR